MLLLNGDCFVVGVCVCVCVHARTMQSSKFHRTQRAKSVDSKSVCKVIALLSSISLVLLYAYQSLERGYDALNLIKNATVEEKK